MRGALQIRGPAVEHSAVLDHRREPREEAADGLIRGANEVLAELPVAHDGARRAGDRDAVLRPLLGRHVKNEASRRDVDARAQRQRLDDVVRVQQ